MFLLRTPALGAILLVAGCGQSAPPPPPTPEVGTLVVRPETVTLKTELPGRTSAYETSDVRPQVSGLLLKRFFQEGDSVRAGQTLYQVDPVAYQAQVANAKAAVGRARASIASTRALATRYGNLVKINAIAKQDYENAVTAADQAGADVAAAQATLKTAQIDLARTRITAPISGRIGRSVSTVGALVTASQTTALTTIQRLDPIYVDINQSSANVLKLRQAMMTGKLTSDGSAGAQVRLKLEDGSYYPLTGKLQFSDVTVDPTTGSITLRALFANPKGLLLPGMYVRAELVEGVQQQAILVSQQAVSRDEKGNPTVLVVGAGDKVELRQITAPRTIGTDWLVTGGLKVGDRVIMDGTSMLRPGATIKPVRWTPKPAAAAPAQGQ
ncbi:efflux RND transporter periplasmic adaptor subunit [Sphingomonas sp. RB3P16]|uniref:efflux RND transporter periplasmic adaptor subunit n=1 Tax=Parasphingomonas frigoris TaxID=3096163 RepID=UPI002FC684DB